MLRALIIAGLSLMLVGFGAAGWQYWQGMSGDPGGLIAGDASSRETPPAGAADGAQGWLVSMTGGTVPTTDVRAYLVQGRAVPDRTLKVTLTASLSDLLLEGETLPDPAYFEVMADIRAPVLAEGLCPVLSQAIAEKCSVDSARVLPGSVDALRGTARFRIELAFTAKSDVSELPDLALHVFRSWTVSLDPQAATARPASAEQALQALVDLAAAACAAPEAGQACRVLRLTLDHDPAATTTGSVTLGALNPLPEAMRVVPELTPAPAG